MSKLAIVSAAQMSKILRHLGFSLVRQKGSHAYFQALKRLHQRF